MAKPSTRLNWQPASVNRQKLRFNKEHLLGSGGFGRVYMGLNEVSGELVAVKEIEFQSFGAELQEMVQRIAREVQLMKRLKHPNIVKYIGADRVDNSLLIYMEYVPGGSLKGLVKKFGKLSEETVQKYLRGILLGLEYLHGQNIAHRDIKGDNALLDVTGEVKLADFGTSKEIEDAVNMDKLHTVTGTPWFMAPEVIKGNPYGLAADIWSIGATTIELLTGQPPFSNFTNAHAAMFAIASSDEPPPMPPGATPECEEFLQMCFQRDPTERASVQDLLSCEFISPLAEETESASHSQLHTPAMTPRPASPASSSTSNINLHQQNAHNSHNSGGHSSQEHSTVSSSGSNEANVTPQASRINRPVVQPPPHPSKPGSAGKAGGPSPPASPPPAKIPFPIPVLPRSDQAWGTIAGPSLSGGPSPSPIPYAPPLSHQSAAADAQAAAARLRKRRKKGNDAIPIAAPIGVQVGSRKASIADGAVTSAVSANGGARINATTVAFARPEAAGIASSPHTYYARPKPGGFMLSTPTVGGAPQDGAPVHMDLEYLEKLDTLRRKGVITELDFEAKKKQILWGMM